MTSGKLSHYVLEKLSFPSGLVGSHGGLDKHIWASVKRILSPFLQVSVSISPFLAAVPQNSNFPNGTL
jgi:hypothetical protein